MKKRILIILALISALVLSACGASQKASETKAGLKIVTTFYPMYDFTKNIVGDQADVSMLITGETEPHDYEPSAKDVAKIQDADVFIYNSTEMEVWVKNVLETLDLSKTKVIEASQGIELLAGSEAEHDDHDDHEGHDHAHEIDPHVWLDPVLAQSEVKTITAGLTAVDEKNKETYAANSQNFTAQLADLDNQYQTAFAAAKERKFVTQHSAFSYLAKRYNLTQVPIAGISPDQEPSPASLAKIEDFVKDNHVNVIYTEELSSTKIAETIANATGAKMLVLNTLEGLSNDKQKAGEDYLSVMTNNLAALKETIK